MKTYLNKITLIDSINSYKKKGKSIGLVPTMGALHQGHLSLVKKGLLDNDVVVVSIFVNPTQFNRQEDLVNYPRTLDRDEKLLKTISKTRIIIYAPSVEDIYNDNVNSDHFEFDGLEHEMEGAFRPGHFDGVGTIVKRLLEIVKPNYAYFGEKDFQQLMIVKKLVELYDIHTEIVGGAIYRATDGLAMSSRNERLTEEHRTVAPLIYETLTSAKIKFGIKSAKEVTEWVEKQFSREPLLELEYFLIADVETLKPIKRKSKHKTYRAFIAVYAGGIRLIDNIALN